MVTIPEESGEGVVITTGCGLTFMVNVPVPEPPDTSVARAVKVYDPVLLGAPVIVPDERNVMPSGKVPPAMLQEYGGTPPVAVSVCEVGTSPTFAFLKDERAWLVARLR